MFGVGLFTGLTVGIIFGLCIYALVESPHKIKVGTPSTLTNSKSTPCTCDYDGAKNKVVVYCGKCGGIVE